jgi:perosamine synthetase
VDTSTRPGNLQIMKYEIPVAVPDLSGREIEYVTDAIKSGWISSTGAFVERFEAEFAQICGTRTSISVSNGTVALHLAMIILGVGPGDEVIVPSLSYIAVANAVRYVGAEPVFADVQPETWCLDPEDVKARISPRTKSIIAVHLYGHPADMNKINAVAREHGLSVVEDAAEAPLATYHGRPVGSLANMAAFSFYGNKILSSGEGGALTLSDHALEFNARMIRNQGMDPDRRYYFPVTGHNFRLTNVACALLCAQLERREQLVHRRRAIYSLYHKLLSEVPGVGFQPVADWAQISPWLFCITVDGKKFGRTRDELMRGLGEKGIDTRPFFIPLHTMPPFKMASRARKERLPVTEQVSQRGMNLPTYPGLLDENVARVCDAIQQLQRPAA